MRKAIKTILIILIIFSILLSVALPVAAYFAVERINCAEDLELVQSDSPEGKTEFYYFEYESGKLLTPKLVDGAALDSGIKYIYTPLGEMPDNLINAFISIEDKRFYRHFGVDLIRSAAAVFNYTTGRKRFGGSTITQQLVKNLTGRNDVSVTRKINEALMAIRLERKYDKSEILEQYLNVINLSGGCMGVGAAAEYYYSKNPIELTLSECATIAAITNNPAYYDPIKHPENNIQRRNTILLCMYEQGYISQKEYIKAKDSPINLSVSQNYTQKVNSWYIDMVTQEVIDDLCRKYDMSRSAASLMLYRGGFKIYTAMDLEIQQTVEKYYANEYNFPVDGQGKTAQSAMIIVDPYTGDILGVAGAIGAKSGNRVQNYATNTKRPPGSAIKPLSVYAPAIDRGLIEWSSVFEDEPMIASDGDRPPWPQNVDRKYRGLVDVKYAVAHSLNTVSVKILDMVGKSESMDFLKNRLLISSLDEKEDMGYASLALGQPGRGVTLRELTAAYSIFCEGNMCRPRSYYKVTDASGKIILESSSSVESVISRESAAIMTKLMETVVDSGTAAGKVSLDQKVAVAGKSGTSGDCRDRYFVGYTPELLAGVWFGYDYPKNLEEFGGNLSVYIWDEVISEIYQRTDRFTKTEFSVPDTVQKLTYERRDGFDTENGENGASNFDVGWFNINHKEE